MKKILSSLFILILFFILAWGVAGWYFGKNAETELKTYLTNIENVPGEKLFRAELIEYKSTLIGAKAKFKISSDTSFLNERLGDFELNARMLNGPIFIHEIGTKLESKTKTENNTFFEVGTTRWRLDFDETSVENEKREYLNSLFPEGLPHMVIVTDFDSKAHYQSTLKTEVADAFISGIYNLENYDNEGEISISDLQYGSVSNRISAPQAAITYKHQRGITAAYKPGTTNISIPELSFHHSALDKSLVLNFIADAAIQSTENKAADLLNGLLKISLKKSSKDSTEDDTQHSAELNLKRGSEKKPLHNIPLEKANIKIHFDKIPAEAFIALSEEKAEEDNIYQQIQWTLEESAELPEGRDQIRALNDRLQDLRSHFPAMLENSVFINKSQIRLHVTAENKSQKSTLKGKIRLNKDTGNPENVLHLLKGDAKVVLKKDLFTFLKPLAELKTPSFKLTLQNGKLTLNN